VSIDAVGYFERKQLPMKRFALIIALLLTGCSSTLPPITPAKTQQQVMLNRLDDYAAHAEKEAACVEVRYLQKYKENLAPNMQLCEFSPNYLGKSDPLLAPGYVIKPVKEQIAALRAQVQANMILAIPSEDQIWTPIVKSYEETYGSAAAPIANPLPTISSPTSTP
jgi:hypothetical protein